MAGSFNSLQTTTIREFSGGLNVVTDDLNMDTSYSTIETNVFNNINGTKSVRYGTKMFANFTGTEVHKTISVSRVTKRTYRFNQPQTNRLSVGTYVSVYQNSTDINPVLSGTVVISTQTYFEIYSYSTFVNLSGTVYLDYFVLDINYNKISTNFVSFNDKNVYVLDNDNLKELNYLYVGSTVQIYYNNSWINKVVTDIDYNNGYFYIDNNENLNQLELKFSYNTFNGSRIINGTYFIDKLVLVSDIGEICLVDGEGNLSIVFNSNIANIINPEQPGGWHNTTSVCFAVFNGILTIWNGLDKPLAVDLTNSKIPCNYLVDTGTMSNSYVPIAKYAIAFNHYLVVGNIYDEEEGKYVTDRLCISAKDSIGTFYTGLSTDTGNDAVNIDLGTIISSNSQTIKGLSRYRNQLVVGFDDVTVFGTLGDYVETEEKVGDEYVKHSNHIPKFEDVIDNHGCISNRTFASISSELICLDYSGLPNFRRGNLTAQVVPKRISEKIAPELYQSYIKLDENVIEDQIFGIINPKENQYLLFIPNNSDYSSITETICYAYTLNSATSSVSDGAWSKFIGWNFDYGITSALNTVFLGKGKKLYVLGSIDNPYYADYIDDPLYPAENKEDTKGKAIDFIWEFPWADFGDRSAIKKSRYLALSTTGTAKFNIDFFVDYIYKDRMTDELLPSLSMDFVAGDSYGYGNGNSPTENLGNQLYGGGRRTNTEFLFAWTTKFKIGKFRISGSTKYKLNINSITLYYLRGNIRR